MLSILSTDLRRLSASDRMALFTATTDISHRPIQKMGPFAFRVAAQGFDSPFISESRQEVV